MKKTKLIFVIGSLKLGGAEKSLVNLLQLLDYSKIEAKVLVFAKGGALEKQVPQEVEIMYQSMPKIPLLKKTCSITERFLTPNTHPVQIHWKYIKNSFAPIKESFDFGIAYNQGFATYYVAKYITAKKKFFWQNSDYIKAKYDVDLDIPYFKKFDKVVAVSELAKQTIHDALIKKGFEIPIEIIKDISNKNMIIEKSNEPYDLEFSKKAINIVTVGRLVKPKGLHLAVESCKLLIEKGLDVKWYLIGEGGERKKLTQLIKKLSLENNFILLGAKANPYPYVKNCDIYVQTSIFEGLGLTLIEALYLQKPIVSTNFDTAFSLINNNKTGVIVEKDPVAISNGISNYIDNPEFKNTIIENISQLKDNDTETSLKKFNELIFS